VEIEEQLQLLPAQPGVYLMRDAEEHIIYVGKARQLSHRVRSYFQNRPLHGPKIGRMVELVQRIQTIVTDTEVEALVLEEQLIRKYQPRYNTLLKNSKGFPYIRISWQDTYPRVEMARQRTPKDTALYYGPYPSASAVRSLLNAIREIFPVEKCKDPRKEKQVCIYYNIKRCLGHCQKKVTSEAYKEMLQDIRLYLEGKSDQLQNRLTEKMQAYSSRMQYEEAAQMRDTLGALRKFIVPPNQQKIVGKPDLNADILHFARNALMFHLEFFPVRQGLLQPPLPHTFAIEALDETPEILVRFLYDYYSREVEIPGEILIPLELPEQEVLEAWLTERRGARVYLRCPQRGSKKALLDMAAKNVSLGLQRAEKEQNYEQALEGLQELATLLGLPHPPERIEGFDISHFQGQQTVASMVVAENGFPAKHAYRRFKIRVAEGIPDDFASMEEVVGRRYRRVHHEGRAFPDLILIDGGRGQVSAALKAFAAAGISPPPLIGLAKKEELIIVPDRKDPIRLPRHSPALKLLQQLRDESHRFALGYHRQLRSKRVINSELNDIPGVGPHRRQVLLRQFGSVARIKTASVAELVLGGLPRTVAEGIYQYFRTLDP
jgi:excinuclease ABC subunit C